jgi:hypothetical protein
MNLNRIGSEKVNKLGRAKVELRTNSLRSDKIIYSSSCSAVWVEVILNLTKLSSEVKDESI